MRQVMDVKEVTEPVYRQSLSIRCIVFSSDKKTNNALSFQTFSALSPLCSVSLPEEPPSAPPQNVIASGRTNQSIMIQWQPPPESHQNGVLRGYSVR